ncbi:MAG TPA: HAD-IA family hydrolase [Candidatus Thermoplasmatota archaeon]|nr:HAD-IA family hydrolase [Candidatus Thermoplasmatota archaeon]
MIRAVLFDLVGTLLDEGSDYDALDAVMARVIERFGFAEKPGDLSGAFAVALMDRIAAEPHLAEPAAFQSFESAAKDIFADLVRARGFVPASSDVAWFWDAYVELQRQIWRLYPDARKALKAAKALGLHVGVVTDADRYLATEIFPVLALEGTVDAVTTAEEAGYVKPHPAIFRVALAKAGVAPEEAVFVGDSFERDIEGARAAGIARVVLVDRHGARTVDVEHRVKDLAKLGRHLERLAKREGGVSGPST